MKNYHHFVSPIPGFTLTEVLVAISLFSIVATIVSGLYIQSFRESAFANSRNQIYDDARFILSRIGDEIRDGMVDYDEYYNQNVVIGDASRDCDDYNSLKQNYGQNFGKYYSAFFNPGEDNKLGFFCNDGSTRNKKQCPSPGTPPGSSPGTPQRRTIDRNTGQNPFDGKYNNASGADEDAFCGYVYYSATDSAGTKKGKCGTDNMPDLAKERVADELYLISADAQQKTILAREKTGDYTYALSMLRLAAGTDANGDGLAENFVCADGFVCSDGNLPRLNCSGTDTNNNTIGVLGDLDEGITTGAADTDADDFSKDFIPISPLRVNVTKLKFIISPLENPHYAFAENNIEQPRVTIILTVAPRAGGSTQADEEVTLVETVSTRTITPIPSPISVE